MCDFMNVSVLLSKKSQNIQDEEDNEYKFRASAPTVDSKSPRTDLLQQLSR